MLFDPEVALQLHSSHNSFLKMSRINTIATTFLVIIVTQCDLCQFMSIISDMKDWQKFLVFFLSSNFSLQSQILRCCLLFSLPACLTTPPINRWITGTKSQVEVSWRIFSVAWRDESRALPGSPCPWRWYQGSRCAFLHLKISRSPLDGSLGVWLIKRIKKNPATMKLARVGTSVCECHPQRKVIVNLDVVRQKLVKRDLVSEGSKLWIELLHLASLRLSTDFSFGKDCKRESKEWFKRKQAFRLRPQQSPQSLPNSESFSVLLPFSLLQYQVFQHIRTGVLVIAYAAYASI